MKLKDTVALVLIVAIIVLVFRRKSSGVQTCLANVNTGVKTQISAAADCSKMSGGNFTVDVTTGAQANKKFCCNSA